MLQQMSTTPLDLLLGTTGLRHWEMITSTLVFAQWTQIFHDDMTATAALDRGVHHSVILELTVPSHRPRPRELAHKERKGEKSTMNAARRGAEAVILVVTAANVIFAA